MKTQVRNLLKIGVLSLILVTSVLNPVKAQENKSETVRIKVICNENGTHTTMDTTFTNSNMDITTIIESLNIPDCGGGTGDLNIDSIVNVALSAINLDSIVASINDDSIEDDVLIINDKEEENSEKKCKMIRIKMDGDLKTDSSYSFVFNDLDSLIGEEAVKVIIKDFHNNDESGNKVVKKKMVICKIVMLETDKTDNQIIKKSVKNIDNNTLEVEKMSFYPNPTSGKFKLDFSLESEQDVKIKILDAAGKEVYNEELKDFSGWYSKEIDISGNKKGVYFIIINQGDKYKSKKIVLE